MQIVLIIFSCVILIFVAFIFNRFVRYRNNVRDAWSNIDVFLKKRYELVPSLVNIVKGYATHEHQTLLQVTEARSKAMHTPENNQAQRQEAENLLTGRLKNLVILQENYPDLKANNSFLNLQLELKAIEEDLEKSRRYYNATVRENNTFAESFPGNIFRALFGFKLYDFFSLQNHERDVNAVEL